MLKGDFTDWPLPTVRVASVKANQHAADHELKLHKMLLRWQPRALVKNKWEDECSVSQRTGSRASLS